MRLATLQKLNGHPERRMSIPINHAHLIHNHADGRSSTRLHAPPGGKSSMGTSFGWADEAPAPAPQQQRRNPNASSFDAPAEPQRVFVRKNKNEFVDSRIGAGVVAANENANNNAAPADGPSKAGFGDTGASCVRINNAPGGKNAMGTSFGW